MYLLGRFIAAAGATSAGVDECGTDLIFGEGDDAFNADRFLRIVPEVIVGTVRECHAFYEYYNSTYVHVDYEYGRITGLAMCFYSH